MEQGYNFIFVAKASSHKTLYEWIDFSEKNGEMRRGEIQEYEKGKRRIYQYRYVNNVPMRESEPSLMVNWYEVEIFDPAKNKVIYKNSFITNHELNEKNIFPMIVSGRTRWKAVRPRVLKDYVPEGVYRSAYRRQTFILSATRTSAV